MLHNEEYICAHCGELNLTLIDFSESSTQSHVEDCKVCHRPNCLYITIDKATLEATIDAEKAV